MPTKKNLKRAFASELQSLPVQLVPPDPLSSAPRQKTQRSAAIKTSELPEVEPDVLVRLISKIKRI